MKLVKIQTKTIRKKAKRGQPPYVCKQHLMPFPTSQNEELAPFLKKDLQFSMKVEEDTLKVTLKKEKTDGTLDENA